MEKIKATMSENPQNRKLLIVLHLTKEQKEKFLLENGIIPKWRKMIKQIEIVEVEE